MSPATVFLIAANLLPLAGVFFWGWDIFILLILYWLETLVVAFWAVVKLVLPPDAPPRARHDAAEVGFVGRVVMALFICVHAGIFMAVHFMFLWVLFSGEWSSRVHSVAEFWNDIVIGTDLWAPLLFLFVVRGWQVFSLRIQRTLGLVPANVREPPSSGIPGGLYARIFVMQFTIIFGGWLAMSFGGGVGALVVMIVAKTVVEVFFDPMLPKAEETRGVGAAADR